MINKYIIAGCIFAIYSTCVFFSGWYVRTKFIKPKLRIVERTKIKTKYVYRDYKAYTNKQLTASLQKYDLGIPRLDGHIYNNTTFRATAGLSDRNWSRDFKLEVGESSNFKFYIGLAAGTLITFGIIYIRYKL